jgi:hypothetical protein
MVASVSILPVSMSPPSASAARALPKQRGEELAAEFGGIAPVAFESLLEAARTVIATEGAGGDKTSPFQVFEPNITDAHKRREAALREEARADDPRSITADRFDRTSVHTRKMLQAGRVCDAGTQAENAGVARAGAKTGPGKPSDSFVASDIGGRTSSSGEGRPAMRSGDMVVSPAQSRSPDMQANAADAPRTVASSTLGQGVSGADRACAGGVAPGGASGAAKTQSPAQQVVQLVAAGRIGEGDGVRATPSPPATGDARQAGAEQKAVGRGATAREAGADASPRQTGGADGKPGAARSAFDELVRSIRLQTGSRWSSATLHLEPPRLGRLRVDVRVTGNALNIDVHTETEAARELVTRRAAELRAALEQQGIHVDRFEVVMETPEPTLDDSRFDGGASASLTTNRERKEQSSVSPPTREGGSSDRTEASRVEGAVVDEAVVSETRLDIRV